MSGHHGYSSGAVVVVHPDELRALVRDAVREAIADRPAATSAAEWLDTASAAALLGVNPRTITKRAAAGEIPASRIGKLWRFRRSDLERLLVGSDEGRAG